ncbi:MAG: hypothetical protein L6V87_11840 [Ruminococcus sp.]|nr:MAG: hypothetical protein L6V87_11840 [Ruminococcus sp.]
MKINEPAGIKEYPALNTIPESAKQIAKLNIMFALANLYLVAGKISDSLIKCACKQIFRDNIFRYITLFIYLDFSHFFIGGIVRRCLNSLMEA